MKCSDLLVVIFQLIFGMFVGDLLLICLEQVWCKLFDLFCMCNDVQIVIVVYVGSVYILVLLLDDQFIVCNLFDVLKFLIMFEFGQCVDFVVCQVFDLLEQGVQGCGCLLLLISELSEFECQGICSVFEYWVVCFVVFGVGMLKGVLVQQEDGSFFKDDQGGIFLFRFDESGLCCFVVEIGVGYQCLWLNDCDFDSFGLLVCGGMLEEDCENVLLCLQCWVDQGYWLFLLLFLLVVCVGWCGWLFCLLLLMLSLL